MNHAFVRRYRLGEQPIGRTVRIDLSNGERRYEIVGLVGDSVYTSPRDGMMATMYVPLAQLAPTAFGETVVLTINARGQRAAVLRLGDGWQHCTCPAILTTRATHLVQDAA